jgi:hypothetical protein
MRGGRTLAALVVCALVATSGRRVYADDDDTKLVKVIDARMLWINRTPHLDLYTSGKNGTRIGGLPDV